MVTNEMIDAGIRGDDKAFHAIYKLTYSKLYPICLRYASSIEEALDWCQEGYLKLFTNLNKFTKLGSFEGWAKLMFRNFCIDQYRKAKHDVLLYSTDITEVHDLGTDFEVKSLDKIDASQIFSIMNKELNTTERVVFNMFVIDGYKHKDIAKELNIKITTIRSIYRRAKLKIRDKIEILNN